MKAQVSSLKNSPCSPWLVVKPATSCRPWGKCQHVCNVCEWVSKCSKNCMMHPPAPCTAPSMTVPYASIKNYLNVVKLLSISESFVQLFQSLPAWQSIAKHPSCLKHARYTIMASCSPTRSRSLVSDLRLGRTLLHVNMLVPIAMPLFQPKLNEYYVSMWQLILLLTIFVCIVHRELLTSEERYQ